MSLQFNGKGPPVSGLLIINTVEHTSGYLMGALQLMLPLHHI
jgi:hypothetical protein